MSEQLMLPLCNERYLQQVEYAEEREKTCREYASLVNRDRRPDKYAYWIRTAEEWKQEVERLKQITAISENYF